jgi:hypothetical protein
MTLAMRASARLTIEPGIQLRTVTGRTLTVPTSTTTRSGDPCGAPAAFTAITADPAAMARSATPGRRLRRMAMDLVALEALVVLMVAPKMRQPAR